MIWEYPHFRKPMETSMYQSWSEIWNVCCISALVPWKRIKKVDFLVWSSIEWCHMGISVFRRRWRLCDFGWFWRDLGIIADAHDHINIIRRDFHEGAIHELAWIKGEKHRKTTEALSKTGNSIHLFSSFFRVSFENWSWISQRHGGTMGLTSLTPRGPMLAKTAKHQRHRVQGPTARQ